MNESIQGPDLGRLEKAWRLFDEANARDPNRVEVKGASEPRELAYAQWLTHWLLKLRPESSEELRLAARCQHLRRWEIPRSLYPMNRAGYLQWREVLKKFHAHKAGEILRQVGYSEEIIERVQKLNRKEGQDPESRALEDALCLVFLEHQFADLAARTPEEKMLTVLRRTWKKMTPPAQKLALRLSYAEREQALLNRALQTDQL